MALSELPLETSLGEWCSAGQLGNRAPYEWQNANSPYIHRWWAPKKVVSQAA